jgi:hypothetical protein
VLLEFIGDLRKCNGRLACSLRVAFVIVSVVVLVLFVFLFFLGWLLSKEDLGSYRPIKSVRVKAFWTFSAHVPHGTLCPLARAAGCSLQALPGSIGWTNRSL